jgi:lysophospholipase L1-like esterase
MRLFVLFFSFLSAPLFAQETVSTVSAKPNGFPKLVLIGDSTVATYPKPPATSPTLTGWGQVLDQYLVSGVSVRNEAISGRSSRSFLLEGAWQKVITGPCDYLLIQFGHNDGKTDVARHTEPGGTYDEMLRGYIHQARGLGIKPVLITPVARMLFDGQGKIHTQLDAYVAAMKHVAELDCVPLVDLHARSKALLEKMGPQSAAKLQANADDHTHFSREGGLTMAQLVAEGLSEAVPELAAFLKPRPMPQPK